MRSDLKPARQHGSPDTLAYRRVALVELAQYRNSAGSQRDHEDLWGAWDRAARAALV